MIKNREINTFLDKQERENMLLAALPNKKCERNFFGMKTSDLRQ